MADAWVGQGRQLLGITIAWCRPGETARGGRMQIYLGETWRQVADDAEQALGRHRSAPTQAKDVVGDEYAGAPKSSSRQGAPETNDRLGTAPATGLDLAKYVARLEGHADGAHAAWLADLEDEAGDRRMEVEVFVGVDVVEVKSGRREGIELGDDLRPQLPSGARMEEKTNTGAHHVISEPALGIN